MDTTSEALDPRSIVDAEHLRLVRLGYFISAGVAMFFGAFGFMYVAMGVVFAVLARSPANHSPQPPPAVIGVMMGAFGLAFVALGAVVAALRLRAARCVRERRSLQFCRVVAALSCLEMPYGTAFGVLALLVFARPSVTAQFGAAHDEA